MDPEIARAVKIARDFAENLEKERADNKHVHDPLSDSLLRAVSAIARAAATTLETNSQP